MNRVSVICSTKAGTNEVLGSLQIEEVGRSLSLPDVTRVEDTFEALSYQTKHSEEGGKRVKRGRKLGYRSATTALEGSVCKVCGDQAGRHSYYGAYTCKSCKAFFRRVVQRQSYHGLVCRKNERCPLDPVTRSQCMACRWRACIAAGMRIPYVKSQIIISDTNEDVEKLAGLSERMMKSCLFLIRNVNLTETQIDLLTEHQALLFMPFAPGVKPLTLLLTDSVELLGLYRKILCLRRLEEAGGHDLYPSLYPPGWCLLPHLEVTHRRLWRDVSQFNKLDRVGQYLVQLLILFGAGFTEEQEVDSASRLRDYCRRQLSGENYRCELGKIIMTRQFLRELSDISQLKSRQ